MIIRNMAKNSSFKRLVSLLLSFCVVFTTVLSVILINSSATADTSANGTSVLHIKDSGTTNVTRFGKKVNLQVGKTYCLEMKADFAKGQFRTQRADEGLAIELFFLNSDGTASGTNRSSTAEDYDSRKMKYEVVDDENGIVRFTITVEKHEWDGGSVPANYDDVDSNGKRDFVILFKAGEDNRDAEEVDVKLSEIRLYEKDDSAQTDCFNDTGDFTGWYCYKDWNLQLDPNMSGTNTGRTYSAGEGYLSAEYITITDGTSVLHIKDSGTTNVTRFGKKVNLQVGKTYYLEMKADFTKGQFRTQRADEGLAIELFFLNSDGTASGTNRSSTAEDYDSRKMKYEVVDDENGIVRFTITVEKHEWDGGSVPANYDDVDSNGKRDFVILFKAGEDNRDAEEVDVKLSEIRLYEKDDSAQTDCFNDTGDFTGWYCYKDWNLQLDPNMSGTNTGRTYSAGEGYLSAEYIVTAPSEPVKPTVRNKMLYFRTGGSPIYSRVNLAENTKYKITFNVSNSISDVDVAVCRDGDRADLTLANKNLVQQEDKGTYTYYEYEFTTTTIPVDDWGNYLAFVGVVFGSGDEGYLFDVKLTTESGDTDLFANGAFKDGLNWWAYGLDVWFASWTEDYDKTEWTNNGNTSLMVEDLDKTKFEAIKPDLTNKAVRFKNGANSVAFASRIYTVVGQEIILTFSAFSTDEVGLSVLEDGLRAPIKVNEELIGKEKHENYVTYTYKFIIPETYTENMVFIGIDIPYYAEGYIFDVKCYLADDPKQKNLYSNSNFKIGLDSWIWGWKAWFTVWDQISGTTEWTDGINELEIVDLDLTSIDDLLADINRNDGEWWNPADILKKEEEVGYATLKGTIKNQNNELLSGIKLLLKSESKSYNAITGIKGAFLFENIIADYYELYLVNSNGKNVSTGFYLTFQDGDVIELKLLSDTTSLINDVVVNDTVETVLNSFDGTVYTPELKTVSDLKLYLRGFGETTTDKDGSFIFENLPAGEYEIYTVLDDGSEYIFRKVSIEDNIKLSVKLKYDVSNDSDNEDISKSDNKDISDNSSNTWIWICVIVAAVLLVAGGIVVIVLIRKKRSR